MKIGTFKYAMNVLNFTFAIIFIIIVIIFVLFVIKIIYKLAMHQSCLEIDIKINKEIKKDEISTM